MKEIQPVYRMKIKITNELIETPIQHLHFKNVRAYRLLDKLNVKTIGDLLEIWEDLPILAKHVDGCGTTTVSHIKASARFYFEAKRLVVQRNIVRRFCEEA